MSHFIFLLLLIRLSLFLWFLEREVHSFFIHVISSYNNAYINHNCHFIGLYTLDVSSFATKFCKARISFIVELNW